MMSKFKVTAFRRVLSLVNPPKAKQPVKFTLTVDFVPRGRSLKPTLTLTAEHGTRSKVMERR